MQDYNLYTGKTKNIDLNIRQSKILNYINSSLPLSREEVETYISSKFGKISKNTIIRDLEALLKNKLIKKEGFAKNIKYSAIEQNDLLRQYDTDIYFEDDTDERIVKFPQFNFEIFENLHNLFNEKEIKSLKRTNEIYCAKIKKLPPAILKKEFERLLIELSWKSSKIEGNTYSLLDTESLIKDNIEASGHNKSEARMILNHKFAIEYIYENKDYFKILTLAKLEELHKILTKDLNINANLRKAPVGITGTKYTPLSNEFQIKEAIEKTIDVINKTENPIEKALIAVLMISYIQPFEDGNKRTGRILANAILYSYDYCILSYRSVKETEYKKAALLFYENNSMHYFKQIFMQQFKFAVDTYF